jgi:CRP/FNR family transcriptional regulator, cyclic AMP receptor protein
VRSGRLRQFRDSLIYATGDTPNGFFAVLSGDVRVSYSAGDGRLALLLVAAPGTWIGETSMFDGRPRYSDALAVGRATLLHLGPAEFTRVVGGRSDRYEPFVRLLCDRHRAAMDFIAGLGTLPASARLAQRLIELGSAAGSKRAAIHLSQDDLAAAVGVSRQTVCTILQQWKRARVVSLAYRTITVEDRGALLRIAKRG